jgi:LDH2 family malate/lactate/ureidoglycolate dehydrogenase
VEAFKATVDSLIRDLRGSNRMLCVERILMPGEHSRETRGRRGASGIPLDPTLHGTPDPLAGELGIERLA